MNPLALAILLGGAVWLYTRQHGSGSGFPLFPSQRAPYGIDPRTGYPIAYDLGALHGGAQAVPGPGYMPWPYPPQLPPGNANPNPPQPSARPGSVGVPVPVQVGIGAGTTIAGAAVAGTLSTGLLAATGIGAAGAILAWAIGAKGLFRGGEEGIYVNPARDAFLANFAELDAWRDTRNPHGFSGLAALMWHLDGQTDAAAVQVFRADTRKAFEAAVENVSRIAQRNPTLTNQTWAMLKDASPF